MMVLSMSFWSRKVKLVKPPMKEPAGMEAEWACVYLISPFGAM